MRLPVPGSDDGQWGTILNDYLLVEHNADGTLKVRTDGTFVATSGAQSVDGVKTFTSIPVIPTTTPTSGGQVASKAYVDSVSAPVTSVAGRTGDVVLGESDIANLTTDLAAKVDTTNAQSVGGIKTFTSIPVIPTTTPTAAGQVASKSYVDSVVVAPPVTSVAGKTGAVVLVESDVTNLTTDLAQRTTVANGGGETYFDAGSSGAAKTIDLANGNVQKLTLTANCTITLTSPATGAFRSLLLYVFQDGTGSRTITWPGSVKWGTAGAPTLSTGASKMDKILLDTVDGGTTWYGAAGPGGY
jgi:hypothetical protein